MGLWTSQGVGVGLGWLMAELRASEGEKYRAKIKIEYQAHYHLESDRLRQNSVRYKTAEGNLTRTGRLG